MVASGPLQATARSATGAPKSITDSRDGTLGRSELLPHQRDIVAIIVAGGPPVQEGLVAPSDAPELEPLKLPSRVAVASFAPALLMTARTARRPLVLEVFHKRWLFRVKSATADPPGAGRPAFACPGSAIRLQI
jgi:hypothetical protein